MARLPVTQIKKFSEIFSSWKDRSSELGGRTLVKWPTIAKAGDMVFSGFCTVEFLNKTSSMNPAQRQWSHRFYEVTVPQSIIDTVMAHTISVEYDTMNFALIEWGNNRTLVTCSHSKIIGSVWLAIIDTDSVPRLP